MDNCKHTVNIDTYVYICYKCIAQLSFDHITFKLLQLQNPFESSGSHLCQSRPLLGTKKIWKKLGTGSGRILKNLGQKKKKNCWSIFFQVKQSSSAIHVVDSGELQSQPLAKSYRDIYIYIYKVAICCDVSNGQMTTYDNLWNLRDDSLPSWRWVKIGKLLGCIKSTNHHSKVVLLGFAQFPIIFWPIPDWIFHWQQR